MNILIYIIVVCVIIFIFISLLPILIPAFLFLILAAMVFTWYMKRKVRQHMDTYEENWNTGDDASHTFDSHSTSPHNDDVFDVEFTEREDTDK